MDFGWRGVMCIHNTIKVQPLPPMVLCPGTRYYSGSSWLMARKESVFDYSCPTFIWVDLCCSFNTRTNTKGYVPGPWQNVVWTLPLTWINYIHYKVWDELFINTFSEVNSTLYWACDSLSILGLKFNYVSKRSPGVDSLSTTWLIQFTVHIENVLRRNEYMGMI